MAFVEFKDVRKIYHMGSVEVRAVDGMDFEIEEGELCVIVGPSGAGKTTVLNMLGGMDSCTSGIITLDGKDVGNLSERERTLYRRHDIGFVFQFYNLVQNLTALENVELATQICKNPMRPWVLQKEKTVFLLSFPAVSNSAFLSLELWQKILGCFYVTNQQEPLIIKRASRF